jgi:hypothetical protein
LKKAILILILLAFATQSNSQSLFLNFGNTYLHTVTVQPPLFESNSVNNSEYFSVEFQYPLKKRFILNTEFSKFNGWSDFDIQDGDGWGFGSAWVELYRVLPKIGYNIFPDHKRIKVYPIAILGIEFSKPTSNDGITAFVDKRTSEDFEGTVSVRVEKRTQVLPGLGLSFDWNPFWKIQLQVQGYYTFGFKEFQAMQLDYSYKGVPQTPGIWSSRGDGLILYAGIGFRLWDSD